MGGEPDAVIGEAILGKIISSDLFVPFPRADLLPTGGLDLAALLLPFFLEQAGGQDFHGGGPIFDLGTAVLATNDQPGGNMKDLNR